MSSEVKCWCRHCREELAPSHTGACPNCGKTGKDCVVTIHETVGIKTYVSAKTTHTYFEYKDKKISAVVLSIVVDTLIAALTTLVGFFCGGILGAIIGFILAMLIAFIIHVVFKRKIKTQIREITTYN